MKATLKFLRTIQIAMIIAALLYLYLPEAVRVQPKAVPPIMYYCIAVMTMGVVVTIFIVRRRWTTPVENELSTDPENKEALLRLRKGYVLIYGMSEAAVLFGLQLRFIGFTRLQVIPFYITGGILLLYFFPRRLSETSLP